MDISFHIRRKPGQSWEVSMCQQYPGGPEILCGIPSVLGNVIRKLAGKTDFYKYIELVQNVASLGQGSKYIYLDSKSVGTRLRLRNLFLGALVL